MSSRNRNLASLLLAVALGATCAGCSTQGKKKKKEFVYLDQTPVMITEVHYGPSKQQGRGATFIELANVVKSSVDVSGWQVTGAGRLKLPAGTTIAPGEAIVVCGDADTLRAVFSTDATATFTGKLANKETIRIEDPQGRVADEVKYNVKDSQVKRAANTGLSIHRQRVRKTDSAGIWAAKTPSPGRVRVRRS